MNYRQDLSIPYTRKEMTEFLFSHEDAARVIALICR